jgi:NitT/TauT family transport system ATP-binding protein
MRQRVGLARALTVNADIILMDEPFSSVDEQTRRKFQEDLLDLLRHHQKYGDLRHPQHRGSGLPLRPDRAALAAAGPRVEDRAPQRRPQPSPDGNPSRQGYLDTVDEIWGMLRQYV